MRPFFFFVLIALKFFAGKQKAVAVYSLEP